ncbi:MAG: hypothetical protein KAS71_03890 [Bacteroidales bacterium]|nr:hypothetical protein [Bacteroidales bacterium]
MKRQVVILLVFGLLVGNIQAQRLVGFGGNEYLKGEIFFEDASVLSGYIQVPKLPSSQKVNFKESVKGEKQTIKIHNIKSFKVYSELGDKYTFESNYIDQSKKAGVKRVTKFRIFLLVDVKGYGSLYKIGDEYRTDKDGTLYLYSYNAGDGSGVANFRYYIKKQGAEYAEIFEYENPVNGILPDISRKSLVKSMEVHLSEHPELIEKVRNKELDKMDLTEIFKQYNEYMTQQKEKL